MIKYDFEELSTELYKPFRKTKNVRRVNVFSLNDIFTADIVDMNDRIQHNNGIRYILVVMDVKSRYAWAFPLKNKDAKTVGNAFSELFDKLKITPKHLWVDQGGEFYNKDFEKYLKSKGVELYSTFGDHKASMIERFNRTLKTWMYKAFVANNSNDWVSILPELISKYNNKKHSSISVSPNVAYKDPTKIQERVRKINGIDQTFKVGDLVRVAVKKLTFEKSYTANWSVELFTIDEVLNTNPITYTLKDLNGEKIKGSFYTNELQKTKFTEPVYLVNEILKERTVGKKKQLFVSWVGYRDNMNSWVDVKDVMDVQKKSKKQ
jgi:hypothetical protein